jgi:hypothetical protein
MARISVYALSGFAIAATIWTPLQFYDAGAWSKPWSKPSPAPKPVYEMNRTLKGDRLVVVPRTTVRTTPSPAPPDPVRPVPVRRELPAGCEPSFSPITVPAMAHVAGRCIG